MEGLGYPESGLMSFWEMVINVCVFFRALKGHSSFSRLKLLVVNEDCAIKILCNILIRWTKEKLIE